MSAARLKSIDALFSESAEAVRRNLSLFIFLNAAAILGAAWDMGLAIRDKANGNNWGQVFINSATGQNDPKINGGLVFVFFIAALILYLLSFSLAVLAANHKRVEFSQVWEVCRAKWWKILAVIIILVALVVPGLVLFLIPGFYLISRLALAPVVVIHEDSGVMEAISKSWQLTKGHAWPIFLTLMFAILLSVITFIPIAGPPISVILTIAFSVALPIRYIELKKLAN